MRGLDSEIVKFCVLTQDYKKIALALSDRNIELHAQYGKHYRTRVPKMPTDMIYNPYQSDLIVSSSSDELVRLSLD
jgi:ribosome biogenesis protein ENP2